MGVLSTEQKTLKARLDGKDNTTSSQQEGSGVAQRGNGFYTYVDLMTLLPRKPSQQRETESSKDTSTIESFDHWLEAWSSYERTLVLKNQSKYDELALYRLIIQKANRKFIWKAVYDFDVQFRTHLSTATTPRFDQAKSTTIYTAVLDSSAVRKEATSCQRCKSDNHLIRDCSFRPRPSLEETKGQKKQSSGAAPETWKYDKWYHNSIEGCNLFQRRACQQGKECKRAHVCKTCRGDHSMADCKINTKP